MQKGNTKERILDAALELFSEKGYAGTTVEEVATYVGIKAPTLYKYLSSKEDLLRLLGERFDEQYKNSFARSMKGAEQVRSFEELKEFSMRSVEYTVNDPLVVRVRRMATIEQYRSEDFAERATLYQIKEQCAINALVFRKFMEEGIMIPGDPDLLALEFTAPVTLMIQMCDRQPDKKEEALATVSRHFDQFAERYSLKK